MRCGYRVHRRIVNATTAEHEGVHAYTHVRPLGLDALPHEHARALFALRTGHLAGLRSNFVTCVKREREMQTIPGVLLVSRRHRRSPWTLGYVNVKKDAEPTNDEYLIYVPRIRSPLSVTDFNLTSPLHTFLASKSEARQRV